MEKSLYQPIHITRGEHLESTHSFHAAVVNHLGERLFYFGNPERLTFARSSMKPFQAIPLIESGAAAAFGFGQREIAVSCASHSGETKHRETVQSIMTKINLPEEALQCGTHPPKSEADYREVLQNGKELTPLFSNCSGKHSGMLATAVHHGEEPGTYREVNHPVQQRILKAISEICDYPFDQIGLAVDGCGAPVHRLPLQNVAYGYAQLAKGHSEKHPEHDAALVQLRDAMMAYPDLVGGTNRFDTDVMSLFKGKVVAKEGAEGVQCIGLVEQGIGMAIKVEDGSPRALSAIALKIMEALGVVGSEENNPTYQAYRIPPVQNMRKERIGNIEVDFTLSK